MAESLSAARDVTGALLRSSWQASASHHSGPTSIGESPSRSPVLGMTIPQSGAYARCSLHGETMFIPGIMGNTRKP
jgi:hypothetical protein